MTDPVTIPSFILTVFGFVCEAPETCAMFRPMPPYALPVSFMLLMTSVLPVTAVVVVLVPPAETVPFTTGRFVVPAVPMVSVLSVTEPFIILVPTMSP